MEASKKSGVLLRLFLPLLLLLLGHVNIINPAAAAAAAAEEDEAPPAPTPWPEQFHALMYTNFTTAESGGSRLWITDLYYDWPRRRNMNKIQYQLGELLWDVEWNNGTSYYFTKTTNSSSCRTLEFPVGILPPDWLLDGAVYLGKELTGGFHCHVWTKVDFVWYYEDVLTGRPVRWNFYDGMQQHVMTFEVGVVLEDSEWQAPSYCFTNEANSSSNNSDELVTKDGDTTASSWTQVAHVLDSLSLRRLAPVASM